MLTCFKTNQMGERIILEPDKGGSLKIYGITINTDKRKSGAIELSLSDGNASRKHTIAFFLTNDDAVNISITLEKPLIGWQGAWIEVVNYTNTKASIMLNYKKRTESMSYKEWKKGV